MAELTGDARIRDLKRRLELDPSSRLFVTLAEEYRRSGLLPEALSTLQKGLLAHPGYLSAHVALGRAYLEAGQITESIATFNKVLGSDPGNLVSAKSLADIYMSRGEGVEAIKKYKLYRALSGDRTVDEIVERLQAELAPPPPSSRPTAAPALPPPPTFFDGKPKGPIRTSREIRFTGTGRPELGEATEIKPLHYELDDSASEHKFREPEAPLILSRDVPFPTPKRPTAPNPGSAPAAVSSPVAPFDAPAPPSFLSPSASPYSTSAASPFSSGSGPAASSVASAAASAVTSPALAAVPQISAAVSPEPSLPAAPFPPGERPVPVPVPMPMPMPMDDETTRALRIADVLGAAMPETAVTPSPASSLERTDRSAPAPESRRTTPAPMATSLFSAARGEGSPASTSSPTPAVPAPSPAAVRVTPASALGPESPSRTLGDLYFAQGHFAEALGIYDELVAANPFDSELKRLRRDAEARLLPAASAPGLAGSDTGLSLRLAKVRALKRWLAVVQTG